MRVSFCGPLLRYEVGYFYHGLLGILVPVNGIAGPPARSECTNNSCWQQAAGTKQQRQGSKRIVVVSERIDNDNPKQA
jgi:hypothetical protein